MFLASSVWGYRDSDSISDKERSFEILHWNNFYYLGAFFIDKFQISALHILYSSIYPVDSFFRRIQEKSYDLYWIPLSFVLDCSSLPPRLLDLLSVSGPLWPLPGPHKAAAERTVCAQLSSGILPGWCSLSRYGSRHTAQNWTEAQCCQGGGHECRKSQLPKTIRRPYYYPEVTWPLYLQVPFF